MKNNLIKIFYIILIITLVLSTSSFAVSGKFGDDSISLSSTTKTHESTSSSTHGGGSGTKENISGATGTESDEIMKQMIYDLNPSQTTPNVSADPTKDSKLIAIVSQAFTLIQFIGTGISLIVIMILGLKYMYASVTEKAEIKKMATPIVIGSVLIVATVNIMKIIQEIVAKSII